MEHHDEHEHGEHGHRHAEGRVHEHHYGRDQGHAYSKDPIVAWLQHLFMPHAHGHRQVALNPNLATDRGMWAIKISLGGLLVTAVFQVFVVMVSGSVAL